MTYRPKGDHAQDLPGKTRGTICFLTAGPGGPGGPMLSCVHVQAFGRLGHFASSL